MSWERIKLGELYEVHNGLSKGRQFFGSGYPFLSFSTVFNNWFLPKILSDLVQSSDKERESYSILRGDIFITRTSETMDELGMSSVALRDYPNATYNGFTKRLRPIDSQRILPEFIGYYLRCNEFRNQFVAFSTMTTRASLRNEDLLSIEVPVPPMPTQRRIADILSAYDDLIENNRKQIKLLEEAAQRLYKEWFVDLRFPGHEHTKIVDGVSEGWEKSTVAAVSSILRRGISPRYNENGKFVVINQKCIRQTVVSFDESRRQEKLYPEDLNLQDSDTVICSTGAGTLGRVGQIFGNYPDTTLDSHVTLVRAMEGFGKQYLFQSLNSRQTYLMGMGKGSTNQLELSRGTIQDLDIYIPLKKVLNQFEQVAQPIHDKISVISKSILQLQTARDHLLPKLMSGEVEV